MEYVHTPVLLEEVLQFLGPRGKNELMVDANTGEGGHSYAFLSRYPDLKIVCIDVDNAILEIAKKRLEKYADRIYFYSGWSNEFFADYPSELRRPDTFSLTWVAVFSTTRRAEGVLVSARMNIWI